MKIQIYLIKKQKNKEQKYIKSEVENPNLSDIFQCFDQNGFEEIRRGCYSFWQKKNPQFDGVMISSVNSASNTTISGVEEGDRVRI